MLKVGELPVTCGVPTAEPTIGAAEVEGVHLAVDQGSKIKRVQMGPEGSILFPRQLAMLAAGPPGAKDANIGLPIF